MLDDVNSISQRDSDNMFAAAAEQPKQLLHDYGIATQKSFKNRIRNVVFAGLGGSAVVAELARTWPSLRVPFVISKDYSIPDFVDSDTLVVCASASGGTEETLEALAHAEKKGAQIAVISRGGKLYARAKEKGYVIAARPEVSQARCGVLYDYRALVEILVAADAAAPDSIDELQMLAEPLEAAVRSWAPSVPQEQNTAKQIAVQMAGKTLIIYGGSLTYPVAYKWKIDANENAKNTAWCNALPEFNHNEFIGWSGKPVEKPFAVVDLVSHFEHPRILQRFELIDRLLSGQRPKSITVQLQGDTILEHMLYGVFLGDFATLYLAVLNGVNPSPVELVDKFKKELGQYDSATAANI